MDLSQVELDKLSKNPYLVGIDEAGRGPWAGPVVVCAFLVTPSLKLVEGINDSKKISSKKREKLFEYLTQDPDIYSVGIIENTIIDKVGILRATKRAISLAYEKFQDLDANVIIDGKFGRKNTEKVIFENHADSLYYSVACASIIAKVTRDNMMIDFSKTYPEYCFEKHKGYGTKLHQEMLVKHGVCKIHRLSYKPVAKIAKDFRP
ncbi:ribonuclease HII [Candidatus Dojkabacteria bacterium]|uniref:Ribonuclease n=1 Tax=Candidatus Dojkabacteria bacterium TaxID=2099670 RepID=A0A955RIC5_9BACT|nr:ribonuclease HII [Candidatus Dojkabacteria bacterium]